MQTPETKRAPRRLGSQSLSAVPGEGSHRPPRGPASEASQLPQLLPGARSHTLCRVGGCLAKDSIVTFATCCPSISRAVPRPTRPGGPPEPGGASPPRSHSPVGTTGTQMFPRHAEPCGPRGPFSCCFHHGCDEHSCPRKTSAHVEETANFATSQQVSRRPGDRLRQPRVPACRCGPEGARLRELRSRGAAEARDGSADQLADRQKLSFGAENQERKRQRRRRPPGIHRTAPLSSTTAFDLFVCLKGIFF